MNKEAETVVNSILNAFLLRNPDIARQVASDFMTHDQLMPETIEMIEVKLIREMKV